MCTGCRARDFLVGRRGLLKLLIVLVFFTVLVILALKYRVRSFSLQPFPGVRIFMSKNPFKSEIKTEKMSSKYITRN
jgi:hypothetical protein